MDSFIQQQQPFHRGDFFPDVAAQSINKLERCKKKQKKHSNEMLMTKFNSETSFLS